LGQIDAASLSWGISYGLPEKGDETHLRRKNRVEIGGFRYDMNDMLKQEG
jgi:hypothetical protein